MLLKFVLLSLLFLLTDAIGDTRTSVGVCGLELGISSTLIFSVGRDFKADLGLLASILSYVDSFIGFGVCPTTLV